MPCASTAAGPIRRPNAARHLGELPAEQDNLATKAIALLRRRAGVDRGIAVELVKQIPSAAGLGGGSSDAAAALLAVNALWNLDWPRENSALLAAELGSDVPFFLGRARPSVEAAVRRFEHSAASGLCTSSSFGPRLGCSTGEVFANCRPADTPNGSGPLVHALLHGDTRHLGALVFNRLEPAAASISEWIVRLQREFADQDCLAARMSGSGSAYFGICRHARHARRVARRLQSRDIGRVYAVSTNN